MVTKDRVNVVISNDDSKLLVSILNLIKDKVLENKSICVVCTSEQKRVLNHFFIDQMIPFISSDSEYIIPTILRDDMSLELQRFETQKLLEKFTRYLNKLSDNKIDGTSFQKLLRSKKFTLQHPLSFSLTNLFTYSTLEFQSIRDVVRTGAGLYSEEFDSISKNGLKNLKFREEAEIEELLTEYQSDLDRLKDLHARYSRAFNLEKIHGLEKSKSNETKIREVKERIENLLFTYQLKYGIKDATKPGILSLNKSAKESYESWKALIEAVNSDLEKVSQMDPDIQSLHQINNLHDIVIAINDLDVLLESWWNHQTKNTDDHIKRINHINLQNHAFKELYGELSELLRNMASKAIYARDLECNGRSSIKQLEYLDETILSLSSEMSDLQRIPDYFKWKNFLEQQSSLCKHVFKDLTIIPKEHWEQCFVTNYVNTYCDQNIITIPLFEENEIDNLRKGINFYLENLTKLMSWRHNKELHYSVEFAALADKDISKRAGTGIKGSELLFSGYLHKYPLYLVTPDDDALINYCKENEFCVLNADSDFLPKSGLYIQLPEAKVNEIRVTEQIAVAKELANGLLSIGNNIKIYQMQFANVICTDDEYLPSLLIEEFKKHGIKEFSLGNYGKERLIESIIMTDRPQYCILRDGLFDATNHSNVSRQMNTVNAFEQAGYQIINVWTAKMKEDGFKIRSYLNSKILPKEKS